MSQETAAALAVTRVARESRFRADLPAAIARLRVWHRSGGGSAILPFNAPPGLAVHTCQRSVHVSMEEPPGALPLRHGNADAGAESYQGVRAYEFLLEFATGLRSVVVGESNVLGQLLAAWRAHAQRPGETQARVLAPVMDSVFRDAREIRARHLQGIGGQSYATLARRLLAPGPHARVLIAGFGELGRSMPSRFSRTGLAVYNRSRPATLPAEAVRYFHDAREAAAWATHIVFCLPRESDIDASWTQALGERAGVRVVHLGLRRGARGPWSALPDVHDLDDLFDLQRSQAARRAAQQDAARAACIAFAARAVYPALL